MVNEDTQGNVAHLQTEIRRLRDMLTQLQSSSVPHPIPLDAASGEGNSGPLPPQGTDAGEWRRRFLEAMLFMGKAEQEKEVNLDLLFNSVQYALETMISLYPQIRLHESRISIWTTLLRNSFFHTNTHKSLEVMMHILGNLTILYFFKKIQLSWHVIFVCNFPSLLLLVAQLNQSNQIKNQINFIISNLRIGEYWNDITLFLCVQVLRQQLCSYEEEMKKKDRCVQSSRLIIKFRESTISKLEKAARNTGNEPDTDPANVWFFLLVTFVVH